VAEFINNKLGGTVKWLKRHILRSILLNY
jgi:hypothetical protein